MIYFTKYAQKKFDILNSYKVFITKEQVEDVAKNPEQTAKKGGYLLAAKDNVCVVIKKEDGLNKIITFYPLKTKQ